MFGNRRVELHIVTGMVKIAVKREENIYFYSQMHYNNLANLLCRKIKPNYFSVRKKRWTI